MRYLTSNYYRSFSKHYITKKKIVIIRTYINIILLARIHNKRHFPGTYHMAPVASGDVYIILYIYVYNLYTAIIHCPYRFRYNVYLYSRNIWVWSENANVYNNIIIYVVVSSLERDFLPWRWRYYVGTDKTRQNTLMRRVLKYGIIYILFTGKWRLLYVYMCT